MREPIWVRDDAVRAIHMRQIAEHGGSDGVRDEGLLQSALAKPRNLLAHEGTRATLDRLAAAYAYGIARNHPFIDGNKRVALVVSYTFLGLNGMRVEASPVDTYRTFNDIAVGTLTEPGLAKWFAAHCSRIRSSPAKRRRP